MDYTPHTDEDVRAMLDVIGVGSVEDLFEAIPNELALGRGLDLPKALTESELLELLTTYSRKNLSTQDLKSFAGGGAYDHYVPAPVRALAYRAEFATSYTPYQPELSQGVLGALFEFQTMICELTGMEVSNASLYDGASALVEAINLAASATGRKKMILSEAINPNYRSVLSTFGAGPGYEIEIARSSSGLTTLNVSSDVAAVVIAQPNFFGNVEDVRAIADATHAAGALLIVSFDPLSAGILESPGVLGADVVTGEGQSLGNEISFGGPYLGLFATHKEHVRKVPGRIVGATVDIQGRPGFVLTLQAREQHIRREKANSNVCTNQTLMAIVASVYLSWLGPRGLKELGEVCMARAQHAAELLSSVPGCSLAFEVPFFKEFVLRVPGDAAIVTDKLADLGYLAGPSLGGYFPDLGDCLLVAVTERRTLDDIEGFAKALAEAVA